MFIKPEVVLKSCDDNRLEAWYHSRPYLDPENNPEHVFAMESVAGLDLSLNSLCFLTFEVRSSVLLRELISSIRPMFMWAQTSRVNPINEVMLSGEYEDYPNDFHISALAAGHNSEEPQDRARLNFSAAHSTSYTVGLDYRTLCSFLLSLRLHPLRSELSVYEELFTEVLKSEFSYFDLDTVKYKPLYYSQIFSENVEDGTAGDIRCMNTQMPLALTAQLVRHTQNRVKGGVWTLMTSEILLSDPIQVELYLPEEAFKGMIKHRTDWLADWTLWESFLEDAFGHKSTDQLISEFITPTTVTHPFIKDNLGRISLDDPNPPCPILLEMPALIASRKPSIMKTLYQEAAEVGVITDNPDNKYRKQYLENLEKAGISLDSILKGNY